MKRIIVLLSIMMMCVILFFGCTEETQRIPFKEAESMMTVAYAYENNTGMVQVDITENLSWYDDLEQLCGRINGLSEKKMIPATSYNWEKEEGMLYIESEEMLHNIVLSIRLPDSDPPPASLQSGTRRNGM